MTLLTRAAEALEPGGWVVVKVPSGPAQRRKERTRAWLHRGYKPRLADNLVHVNHFSPRALQAAIARVGLEQVTMEIAPPELPPDDDLRSQASNAVRRALVLRRPIAAWWCQDADRPEPARIRTKTCVKESSDQRSLMLSASSPAVQQRAGSA